MGVGQLENSSKTYLLCIKDDEIAAIEQMKAASLLYGHLGLSFIFFESNYISYNCSDDGAVWKTGSVCVWFCCL